MIAKSLIDIMMRIAPETRPFDKVLSHAHFLATHGRLARRKNSLNDALLALKTSDEILSPLRVTTTDKELAKAYLRGCIDAAHIVPTFAVLKSRAEIASYAFPTRCVIKPTHMSGQVIRRRNGAPLDLERISRWLDTNYYRAWREANYRHLTPKVIVEPFVFDQEDPCEVKFFCFKGKVKIIKWTYDKSTSPHRMLYERNWTALDASMNYPVTTLKKARPANHDAMIAAVEQVAAPFGLVRVDVYTDGADFYLGEITHTSNNATLRFIPPGSERRISAIIFNEEGDRCA
ncbi:ATP-grasp fold amidoligase family protein [Stappia stellulata]|uniref:ATP-grasp fold amidoligase family protein n=1 Tax=Stappia stellulata TaxID=71235 RepID=UPI0003FDF8D9|nr:ATP-grasp fold amidoligase family protein [Stappia stellulata]